MKKIVRVDHPVLKKKIDRSLDINIREGAATSAARNFSLSYFGPAALALGATNIQMGILYAIINLLPGIVQLKAASLIERWSRKKIVLAAVVCKILLVLPFLLVGYLHWIGVGGMIWAFVFLVGLHYLFTGVLYPAWISWMGSLVPDNVRGEYFSKRNRAVGLFGVFGMVSGALILDWFKGLGASGDILGFTLLGFGAIFALSGSIRILSFSWLKKIYEPRIKIRKKDHLSFRDFLRHCREDDFGRFSLFVGFFAFAIGVSTPYWVVYVISELGLSYSWYMGIVVSPLIFQLIFLPLLGKFSDRFGNVRLIRTACFVYCIVPFLWGLSLFVDPAFLNFYLLIVPGIFAGFAWAGYNLALNNYVYDALDKRRTGFGSSNMNLMIGVGGFLGAGLGAFLAFLNVSFMNPILFIILVSGVLRLVVSCLGGRILREVRKVKRFSNRFWFREFGPFEGVMRGVHSFEHLVLRVEHFITAKDSKELGVRN